MPDHIVINFADEKHQWDKDEIALYEKIQRKTSSCARINLNPITGFTEEQKKLLQTTKTLHLMAHCNKGLDFIQAPAGQRACFEKLAEMFAKGMGKRDKSNPVIISIVACGAAERDEEHKSFAEQFHLALHKKGIYSIIKARTRLVEVMSDGSKRVHLKSEQEVKDIQQKIAKIEAYRTTLKKYAFLLRQEHDSFLQERNLGELFVKEESAGERLKECKKQHQQISNGNRYFKKRKLEKP